VRSHADDATHTEAQSLMQLHQFIDESYPKKYNIVSVKVRKRKIDGKDSNYMTEKKQCREHVQTISMNGTECKASIEETAELKLASYGV